MRIQKEERRKIWLKYDKHCAYCGEKIKYENMQIDHIKARRKGGNDFIKNYNPACRSCNATKSTYTIEEFKQRLIDDVNRLRRDSSKFRILERYGIVKQVKTELLFYFEKFPSN